MIRYIIAQIKPDVLKEIRINIGVIAQSDTEIQCRFVDNLSKRILGRFSPSIFDNLNETYNEHISNEEGVRVYSEEDKEYIRIRPLQEEYLYFIKNINKHQLRFGDIKVLKETDIDKAIFYIFQKEIPRELVKTT